LQFVVPLSFVPFTVIFPLFLAAFSFTMFYPIVPKSVIALSAISMLICLPMIALSVVNFGILSIWLNATVAFLILIHHISFYAVAWVVRKRSKPTKMLAMDEDANSMPMATESIAFYMVNIVSLVFLFIINALAFAIMVDITTRGAINSTLPAERIGSAKWNIKVQIGQTAVLGAELLSLGAILIICAMGWKRLEDEKENREEEEFLFGWKA